MAPEVLVLFREARKPGFPRRSGPASTAIAKTIASLRLRRIPQHCANRSAQRPANVESGGQLGILPLDFLWGFALELPETISQHGDSRRTHRMALRNQPARH